MPLRLKTGPIMDCPAGGCAVPADRASVLATLDYATTAGEQSFRTGDFRDALARLTGRGS
jgi:hypothetical protein